MNEKEEIDHYTSIIKETFTARVKNGKEFPFENDLIPNPNIGLISDDKEKFRPQWNELLAELRKKGYSIRDLEPTGIFHSFTCQITCRVESSLLGAIVGISPTFKRYGFYFSRLE